MTSNMQSQSKGKTEELRTSKKKFNFIPSIPLNVQFTKSPSTSSDRPHIATLKLQKITSYPALGSPLKKFEPASSERNIETSSTPRSLYFDTLKLSTASRLQSKRTRYHHNGLSMGSDKKSEMGISTYGSTTFYSEGVFHVIKKKSEFDQETKRSNQEEVSDKVNKIFKQRKKMEASDLHDEKLNSKLQKLIYYFKNMYTKVAEITQASFECSIPDMFVELEHTAYSMIQLFMGQTQGLRDAQIKLEKQVESLQKLTKQEVKEEHRKLKTVKPNEISESIDVHQNARFMEIHRLETQNEYLQSELNKALEILNSECGVEALKGLKSSNQKKLEEYMKLANEKDLLASRFEILYAGMKKTNERLESLNKEAETKLMQAVAKQKYYQDLCDKMEEEKWMYYERVMMQLADYEGLMAQHESDKEDLNKLRDIFLAEKAKQRKEREEKVKQEIEEEENFSKDTIWIQSAKNLFACSMGPGKQIALRKAKEKDKTTAEIDLRNYMFAKPAYEHLIHTNMALNFQLKNQIDLEFIATLRAIFDSKFNELLYFNDHKKISSFPDFVYSWLGKYIFDKKQRKVRIIDITDPNPEHIRTDIYYLLQTPICKRLWDCVIFKEFLDEIYTRDELTYFIQCRNILFQGPQLHDQSASFAYVYYVRLDSAYRVIDYLLSSKYDSKILAEIKQKVKGRSRMKNKVQLIDSGFLLRILLEEYRTYKKERFALIRSILSQEPNVSSDPSKFALGFASFKNFMTSYFPKAYEIEKAELYRKCWVLSNGFVDVDSVLTILNEENIFAREMETRTFELLPSLSYRDNPGKMRTYLLNKYQTIAERLEPLKAIAWELGVESITMDLYNYERGMTNKFAIDGDETNDHGVSLWLYSFMGYIHKVDQINFQINAPEKKMLQKTVETLFPLLEDRIEEACSEQLTKVKVFELNHKAKVLQKFLKAKLSGWYKLMKFLLRKKMVEKYGQALPNSNEIKTISSLKSLL